jgi:Nucleotidyltransferase domain
MTGVEVPTQLAGYLETLVAELGRHAPLEAVYLLGSAALGAYEQGRSDVDIVAVTQRSLSLEERRTLAAAAEAIPCPARKLELVVYPRGSTAWEINLNTSEHVSFDPAEEPAFWFVLDRAIAEQHALPLHGPAWAELFEPEPREAIEAALEEAAAFGGWDDPADAEVAATRARIWRETGRWVSKWEAKDGVPA